MSAFLAAAFAFPTVIFTGLLVLFLLYGSLTVMGLLDLDSLDPIFGTADEGTAGIVGVPLTIFAGVTTLFAWIGSFTAMQFLGGAGWAVKAVVGIGSAVAGLWLASHAVRPLRKLFVTESAPMRAEIVGKICTIRSLHVNDRAGTAEVEDGGAGFIAEVRCPRENELTRGSKAVVYDYDAKEGIYRVGPIEHSLDVDLA